MLTLINSIQNVSISNSNVNKGFIKQKAWVLSAHIIVKQRTACSTDRDNLSNGMPDKTARRQLPRDNLP